MMKKKVSFKAGTYEGTAQGYNGPIKVEVTFSEDEIKNIQVIEHAESHGIAEIALKRIPEAILSQQTLAVDAVSGATGSSNSILNAIENATAKATDDMDELMKKQTSMDEPIEFTEMTTDVVVVGGGGAGLAAAASVHQHGKATIVLEKQAQVGGSTLLSGGGIAATGSKFQKEQGIEDKKESWMKLWKERQSIGKPNNQYPDYDFVDKFMDEAVITTDWLVDYVGHEYDSVYGIGVDPVQRIHNPKSTEQGKILGVALINNLNQFALDNGIEILTETTADKLLTNSNGDIVGVEATKGNQKLTIHAQKVILSTGGYAQNEELLGKYIPELKGSTEMSAASPSNTGDGIQLALEVGATLYEDPWINGLGAGLKIPNTQPLTFEFSKLFVNSEGKRFVNEQNHYAIITNEILKQGETWVVFDSNQTHEDLVTTVEEAMPTEEAVKADSIESLAEGMSLPVENLTETIQTYNQGAEANKDEMGKDSELVVPIKEAPFYAVKMYPVTMGTFAGVKTDDHYQVLREDGSIINNLYATGEVANRVLYNQVYMSGSAVQFALTSGRLSGEHAAKTIVK